VLASDAYLDRAIASGAALARAATADNTTKAYASDFRDFTAWCIDTDQLALPATPATVQAYLASLVDLGLTASTIRRRKAAIASTHRAAGHEPPTSAEAVTKTMRGISRKLGTAPIQKAPATAAELERVIGHIGTTSKRDLRDRALLSLGFGGAFRRSELASIDVEHIARQREGVVITLPRSKTDQEGRGAAVSIPKGKTLRPVAALDAYLNAAGIVAGPVFRPVNKADQVGPGRLGANEIARIVKRRFEAAGFDPEEYSGHSLRAGLVTSALAAGADVFAVADQGRWKKLETVRQYDRRAKAFRNNAGNGVL
jgi:site-specific recombinase XerD